MPGPPSIMKYHLFTVFDRDGLTWLCPHLVHIKEMGFAIMSNARAVRSIQDGAIGADDIHDADAPAASISFFFQRALSHLVRLQALGITSGDMAPQSLRDRRTKLGRGARLRMFQERKYRRCALESIT